MRQLRRLDTRGRLTPVRCPAARLTFRRMAACLAAVAAIALTASAVDPPVPGARDRCAVCGMSVAPYPVWVAAVELPGGRRAFFDGPKDMFRFLHDPERYGIEREEGEDDQPVRAWVTDYYTARPIDARRAFFVAGSDVMGPMGAELVPLATRAQAESFRADHGGEPALAFDEVVPGAVPR